MDDGSDPYELAIDSEDALRLRNSVIRHLSAQVHNHMTERALIVGLLLTLNSLIAAAEPHIDKDKLLFAAIKVLIGGETGGVFHE